MTFRLRFSPFTAAHVRVPLAGLALGLGALAGCESSVPHPLLDAPTEPGRRAEPTDRPSAPPHVPHVHESVTPGSGAIRLPSVLQGYGM
ncbi:hypothetical protein [Rubrivirga sp. IMCC43871]|uniref:hypothetical protein n=1 Tax=Rubrivirga sp. IMCC43871 TaxID=3391575 RepID=UPI00398FA90F